MTRQERTIPWTFTAAALVAVAALALSSNRLLLGAGIAAALVLPYLTSIRLPGYRVLDWTLRIAIWTALIMTGPRRRASGLSILLEPSYVHLFGWLCAAELALRVWTGWRTAPSRGEAVLLAALVIMAASNTYGETWLPLLAPIYVLLTVISLRWISRADPPRVERRGSMLALRGAALALALGAGLAGVQAVGSYEQQLTRWAVELLRAGRAARQSEIGLTTSPRLRAVYNPQPSLDRVALIDGSASERHLRVLAFDTYEQGQWKPDFRDRMFEPFSPNPVQSQLNGSRLRFTLAGDTSDLLPLPLNASAIESDLELNQDSSGAFQFREEAAPDTRYEVVVPPDEQNQGIAAMSLSDEQRQRALALPDSLDRRVIDLAREVAGDGHPLQRVLKLAQHLRSQHSYSLSYDPGDADPLTDFILNRRSAHCQYFASALVILSRAAGVPARYVGGFYAHERYSRNRMVVRGRDAHAWAECWIDGVGWITMDATPASGRPDGLFQPPSRWRRLWERIGDLPGVIRDWIAQIPWKRLLLVIAAAGAPVVLVISLRRMWLRRKRRALDPDAYAPVSPRLREIATRFERWLGQGGKRFAANRTWREQFESTDPACIGFIDAYDEARFGRDDGDALRRAMRLLEELERKRD